MGHDSVQDAAVGVGLETPAVVLVIILIELGRVGRTRPGLDAQHRLTDHGHDPNRVQESVPTSPSQALSHPSRLQSLQDAQVQLVIHQPSVIQTLIRSQSQTGVLSKTT